MEVKKIIGSRLLNNSLFEGKDELDEKLARAHGKLLTLTNGLSEREANDALQSHVTQGTPQHEELQHGLLYSILVEPANAVKSYRDLTLTSRDALNLVIQRVHQIVHEKWLKLSQASKAQIIWFLKEIMKNNVRGAEVVCHSLMRQMSGGDISTKNVWLIESVLDLLIENRDWLTKTPHVLPTAVYTYLRLIVDHSSTALLNLRQKEVTFCITYVREKWTEIQVIGRDLVRLMQYNARIPEFDKLWKEILQNPTVIHSTFTGIQQLMKVRTSRWYIVGRLTPDMENKLVFLTTKVKFGQQKRYQDWFQRQYLSTPESQTLRCDLIRYICAVIHPSNEILCSEIIPRWAIIGWLLTTCTSNVAASNAKLSLFYDWLWFDQDKDNIMNIEPCILVMHHSMRPHPAITATLLDFMCRIMCNFYPPLKNQIRQGIYSALKVILEKRVLSSINPLFDNPKLDKELRFMIRENFSEFCTSEDKPEPINNGNTGNVDLRLDLDSSNLLDNSMSDSAEFSDEEEEIIAVKPPPEIKFRPIKEAVQMPTVDISEHLDQMDIEIRQSVIDFKEETSNELQCEMMDRLMQTIISCHINQGEFDQEMAHQTAQCLCKLLETYFKRSLYPQDPDEDAIEESICSPVYVIFRNVCQTSEEDPARQAIFLLLEEMYLIQPHIGYHFLYFLKVSKVHDERMSAYRDFCNSLENKDIATALNEDLKLCVDEDVRLFTFLVPDIYTQFPNLSIGNTELLQLIVSHIDGTQLQDLICQILQGHLIMFQRDSFLNVLNASLEWETIEQYFLWQLISAHSIPIEHIMPILPKLEFNTHSEALSSILVLLKQEPPTIELMRPILYRECKKWDYFTVAILKFWAHEYEDRLSENLHSFLTQTALTPNKKRKTQPQSILKGKERDGPEAEQVLKHLEHMRLTCRNISFLMHESVQMGLQHVQATSSEELKNKYSDLLALAEDIDDIHIRTTRVLRAVPSRRASSAAGNLNSRVALSTSSPPKKKLLDSESETESSEDEENLPPPKKKKKKATVEDDSD